MENDEKPTGASADRDVPIEQQQQQHTDVAQTNSAAQLSIPAIQVDEIPAPTSPAKTSAFTNGLVPSATPVLKIEASRSCPSSPTLPPTLPTASADTVGPDVGQARSAPSSPKLGPAITPSTSTSEKPARLESLSLSDPIAERPRRRANEEWARRKRVDNESNAILDQLMEFEGLDDVKQQFLDIKSKVDVCKRQGRNLKLERFNIVFQGNPGTGECTSYSHQLLASCSCENESDTTFPGV